MPRKLFLPNIYVFFANICFNIKMADKIKNKYRFRIIIKCKFDDSMIGIINDVLSEYQKMKESKNTKNRVSIDLNPNNWM